MVRKRVCKQPPKQVKVLGFGRRGSNQFEICNRHRLASTANEPPSMSTSQRLVGSFLSNRGAPYDDPFRVSGQGCRICGGDMSCSLYS